MRFNTLTFAVFFAVVLALHSLPLRWRLKKLNLLVASYVFYAAWNPPFVALLCVSTLVDWWAAKGLGRARARGQRRLLLVASLCANFGLLGFFKYGNFLMATAQQALGWAGIHYQPPGFNIILPVGISFYTFQSVSYTLDVYRGKMPPWHSFLDFALYVAFFPQLVAGPIVRSGTFLPQCREPKRATAEQFGWGLALLVLGLFQKMVLADTVMAPTADFVFARPAAAGFEDAWVATLAFSGQIFLDFSGYTNCAIGTALCLGFIIPDNFRAPYAAIGLRDFWRRWHISLSTWLRDYLYIPLGGSRRGPWRNRLNVMITMLLGGLWHGAAWHFVAWGGLHGMLLLGERQVRARYGGVPFFRTQAGRLLLAVLTYLVVCVAWVLFRAPGLGAAWRFFGAMTFRQSSGIDLCPYRVAGILGVTVGLVAAHWVLRERSLVQIAGRCPWWLRAAVLAFLIVAIVLIPGESRAFIYFQF